MAININDVDEFDVTAPADSNPAANAVAENAATGTLVGVTAQAADADATNNTVTYSLYSDVSRSVVWGTTVGVDTVAATGNGAAQSYTVYGRIPAQSTPAPATYSDTITVTVTY